MNLNFWYGGVMHEGFEVLLMKGLPAALKAIKKESVRRCGRHLLSTEDQFEVDLQLRIIEELLRAAAKQKFMKDLKLDWHEKSFKYKLPCGVTMTCKADGGGTYKKKDVLVEIKTAKSVNNNYFTALEFDAQVYNEAAAIKAGGDTLPSKCAYCVLRKPGKYIKKGQSADAFVKEIRKDIADRPDWYFVVDAQSKKFPYIVPLGKTTLRQTKQSLNSMAKLLKQRYDVPEKKLFNPTYWPMNTRQCLNYGACQYLTLCRNLAKWKMYAQLYQQREMLYEEEKKELKNG
jgi:hypothetical protein